MIDRKRLIGVIYSRGLTQSKVATNIGISSKTFYHKMKTGVFGSDEIYKMKTLLSIPDEEMTPIFLQIKLRSK